MNGEELFDGHVELDPQVDPTQATLAVPAGAGVCLFAGQEDQPILLVCGAALRNIVRGRLAEPEAAEQSRRLRLRPITTRLWFRRAWSAFETQLAYFHIAREVYRDDYRQFFPRLGAWFVRVDLEAEYPVFECTDRYRRGEGLYWGPFAEKKTTAGCVAALESGFDLCRHPERLARAPNAEACPYAQMGRCVAVCNGTARPERYRQSIERAIGLLNNLEDSLDEMQQRMRDAAAAREYERAQRIKTDLGGLKKLRGPGARWMMPLDQFGVFSFQPGPATKVADKRAGQPSVTPFVIGPGWITQIESFLLDDAEQGCRSLLDHYHLHCLRDRTTPESQVEDDLLVWACRLLYRESHDKGLYVRADQLDSSEQLAQRITDHFRRPKRQQSSATF